MSEITPYDDEELNEYALRLRCKELRAEAAAMRERAEKAERERDEWKQAAEWSAYLKITAISEAIERCAQVAEGAPVLDAKGNVTHRIRWRDKGLAVAIRALKTGGGT